MVTILNEKGILTPLAHIMMLAPNSRLDVLTKSEIDAIVNNSNLVAKYNRVIDSQSAYEILNAKLQQAAANTTANSSGIKATSKPEESTFEKIADIPIVKSMMKTAGNTIVRSLLVSLGLGGKSSRSTKSSFNINCKGTYFSITHTQ